MQTKFILLNILFSILLVSCDNNEFISYTMPTPETKMCLSGYICPDSTYIVISLNTEYYVDTIAESKRQMLIGNETTVVMYENGVYFDTLQSTYRDSKQLYENIEYFYYSRKKAQEGNQYKVEVYNKKYPTISAETNIPYGAKFKATDTIIEVKSYMGVDYATTNYMFSIEDPSEINNYYLINHSAETYIKDKDSTLIYSEYYLQPNPLFDNFKELITDNYISSYTFFSDTYFNGKSFNYTYKNQGNEYKKPDSVKFVLYSISYDYYMYCLSKYKYDMAQYDANSEPVFVYSNVENGLGIFMGYSLSYNVY